MGKKIAERVEKSPVQTSTATVARTAVSNASRDSGAAATEPRTKSAVVRAFVLLKRIATLDGEVSLTDLSEAQGLSRSVTYKLLQIMVAEGLVQYEPVRKKYGPGLGLYTLASSILHRGSFVQIARTVMRSLVAETGESACLNLLDPQGDSFTVAAVEESAAPLQYVVELGQMHRLHAGASGKAILAFRPVEHTKRILARRLDKVTPRTITDKGLLRLQLARVHELGYCVSVGERLEGAVGIAAPIFDRSEFAVGSVQLTIPAHRFKQKDVARFGAKVKLAGEKISGAAQALGTEQ